MQQAAYSGGMGHFEPRTPADEIADALADLAEARRALEDLASQMADLTLDDESAGVARQVSRNAKIAVAKLDDADKHIRESNRIQLSSVS